MVVNHFEFYNKSLIPLKTMTYILKLISRKNGQKIREVSFLTFNFGLLFDQAFYLFIYFG